nr:WRKY3520 [Atractylodes chinensis]
MGGFDDHAGIIGDWMPPNPSPRSFFSAMLGYDAGSRSVSEPPKDDNSTSGFTFPGPDKQFGSENGDESQRGQAVDQATKAGAFGEQKASSRSGLVERMAARAGYNAPRLNTDIVRPSPDVSQNLETLSPYFTIPPGVSPTSLLDSPVFLSNSLVQQSPTTGKFPFNFNGNASGRSSMMFSDSSDRNKDILFEDINSSSFAFKPVPESAPTSHGPVKMNPPFMSWQSFPSIEASGQSENHFPPQSIETDKVHSQNGTSLHLHSAASTEKKAEVNNFTSQIRSFGAANGNVEQSRLVEEHHDEDADLIISGDNANASGPSEDGYNWRKYGQKQVKGSEYPRSYYKCTHPNCPVKKKVERSHEGHITEIIYKGGHNHPKPPPSRRSGIGPSSNLCDITGVEGDPVWTSMQQKDNADWGHDGNLEVTSSTMVSHGPSGTQFESSDAVDGSSTFSNDEEDDRATHGSVSLGYDGEGDESESKRRKVEAYAADVSGATRAIREPRVVVQTTSEVDILDDGYRWRKYGQKVVKGNPNPRSYYKCTSTGCTVRKHVERASHDLKSVITTYEGKHNHDVPAARNSSHVNSSVTNNTMASHAQSIQPQLHRPEPSQIHNSMARYERPHYGLPGRQQPGPMQCYGYGMNLPGTGLAQMAMAAGLGPNQGTVHQYLGQGQGQGQTQTRQMNEMGMMLPKGQPKVEPVSDHGLNLANASSVYHHQNMNRLPLGPHM